MRPKSPLQGRLLRPNLPGSVSITKIPREPKKTEAGGNESSSTSKMEVNSDEDTQVLDSDEEDENKQQSSKPSSDAEQDKNKPETPESSKPAEAEKPSTATDSQIINQNESKPEPEPIVLTTDEKLPSEDVLENKTIEDNSMDHSIHPSSLSDISKMDATDLSRHADSIERKINPLKNYRHQRPGGRPSLESSLSQLERTASVLNKEGMPDFRRNLDDITQSYSPTGEEKPGAKTKKRRSPAKPDAVPEPALSAPPPLAPAPMPHSVSSLLGPAAAPRIRKPEPVPHAAPVSPLDTSQHVTTHPRLMGRSHEPQPQPHPHAAHMKPSPSMPLSLSHPAMMSGGTAAPADLSKSPVPGPMAHGPPGPPVPPGQAYPVGNPPPDGPYAQYPGEAAYPLVTLGLYTEPMTTTTGTSSFEH